MNKVVVVGRLTAKPELKNSEATSYTRFSVAVPRNYKNAEGERETDFISVLAFGKNAENIVKYLDKGNLIAIDGRIQTGSYVDKEGNNKYTFDVALDNFEFMESKKETKEDKPQTI